MVKKWNITIPELTGDEERLAYLYLPESYMTDPQKRYPVLYMFDGHNVFFDSDATYGKCWGMKEYMDYTETQLIIAAVECNHSPDHGRLKEYTPYPFEDPDLGHIESRGQLTMDWFVNTFKPYIDKHYRTLPGRENTFIAGSSMGGLMSLYALLDYNSTFSKAAALSPSVCFGPTQMDEIIAGAKIAPGTVLYMDYGELEFSNHKGMLKRYSKVSKKLMNKGILVTSRIIPGGTHSEASWERQIPFFMETLLYQS